MRKPYHTLKVKDLYTGKIGTVTLYRKEWDGDEYDYTASFGPNHEASHNGIITIPAHITMEEVVKLVTDKVNNP